MNVKYLKYIPLQALVDLGLNPTQYMLASIVVSFYKEGKPLIDSFEGLAKAVGVGSKTTAKNAMYHLRDLELVTIESGFKKRNANQYAPTKKLVELFGIDRTKSNLSKNKNCSIDRTKIVHNTPLKGVYTTSQSDGAFSAPSSSEAYCKETYNRYKDNFGETYAMKMAKREYEKKVKI